MTWSVAFRLRRSLRESMWVLPLLGGLVGLILGLAFGDVSGLHDVGARWEYSSSTAESVLASVVAASVTLVGLVVTVAILIVQMATGTARVGGS